MYGDEETVIFVAYLSRENVYVVALVTGVPALVSAKITLVSGDFNTGRHARTIPTSTSMTSQLLEMA